MTLSSTRLNPPGYIFYTRGKKIIDEIDKLMKPTLYIPHYFGDPNSPRVEDQIPLFVDRKNSLCNKFDDSKKLLFSNTIVEEFEQKRIKFNVSISPLKTIDRNITPFCIDNLPTIVALKQELQVKKQKLEKLKLELSNDNEKLHSDKKALEEDILKLETIEKFQKENYQIAQQKIRSIDQEIKNLQANFPKSDDKNSQFAAKHKMSQILQKNLERAHYDLISPPTTSLKLLNAKFKLKQLNAMIADSSLKQKLVDSINSLEKEIRKSESLLANEIENQKKLLQKNIDQKNKTEEQKFLLQEKQIDLQRCLFYSAVSWDYLKFLCDFLKSIQIILDTINDKLIEDLLGQDTIIFDSPGKEVLFNLKNLCENYISEAKILLGFIWCPDRNNQIGLDIYKMFDVKFENPLSDDKDKLDITQLGSNFVAKLPRDLETKFINSFGLFSKTQERSVEFCHINEIRAKVNVVN